MPLNMLQLAEPKEVDMNSRLCTKTGERRGDGDSVAKLAQMFTCSAPLKCLGWEAKYIWHTKRKSREGWDRTLSLPPPHLPPTIFSLHTVSGAKSLQWKYDHQPFRLPRTKPFCPKCQFLNSVWELTTLFSDLCETDQVCTALSVKGLQEVVDDK